MRTLFTRAGLMIVVLAPFAAAQTDILAGKLPKL